MSLSLIFYLIQHYWVFKYRVSVKNSMLIFSGLGRFWTHADDIHIYVILVHAVCQIYHKTFQVQINKVNFVQTKLCFMQFRAVARANYSGGKAKRIFAGAKQKFSLGANNCFGWHRPPSYPGYDPRIIRNYIVSTLRYSC